MSDNQSRTEKYGRLDAMADLTRHGYATARQLKGDGAEFTVYVQENQKAGGELNSILSRHGYLLVFPRPYDGDDFVFAVRCEPANWHDHVVKKCPPRDEENQL